MIEIVDYRASWPDEFARIARTIRAGLDGLALRIDHIGSTSVPGLCAKDVIDVQISVAALDDRVTDALHAIGYSRSADISRDHRPSGESGPDEDWDKLFFRPPPAQRRTNTHVRVLGRPNQRYALLFRDYLVAHPTTAAAYGELKRRLARALINPEEDYPDVKDPAVDLIYLPAKRWADATNWLAHIAGTPV
jgi:GrpB-like predicted nucleotidyltransferase (UPF0157 family)